MAILSELVQPVFQKKQSGNSRTDEEREDVAAIKTYRYLRLGLVVIAVAMLASLIIRQNEAGCWQGSMSAYYYSPARAVFVSGLVAIALSLLVIKGSTVFEDLLLTLAGALAPIVAFVPTNYEPACRAGKPLEHVHSKLPPGIVSDVHNNIGALLVAGVAALIVGVVVLVAEHRGANRTTKAHVRWRIVLLVFTAALVGAGGLLLASDDILELHGWSAFIMFGLLAAASIFNGAWLLWINRGKPKKTSRRWRELAILYLAVGGAMVIAGCIIKWGIRTQWDHRTLVLEVVEIGLFAAMWTVQSIERWGKTLQAEPSAGPRTESA